MMTLPKQFILTCLALSACIFSASFAESADSSDYKLTPDDVIDVKVFQEDELNVTTRIASDGHVLIPLIGKTRVAGVTAIQAAEVIRKKLADGYLVKPQVNVSVVAPAKRYFTILGRVTTPGTYLIPDYENITLVQAIGMAGGFSSSANRRKVSIKRKLKGKQMTRAFDVRKMTKRDATKQAWLLPGDIIVVPESIF